MKKSINKGLDYIIKNIDFFNVNFKIDTDLGVKPFIELVFLYNLIRTTDIDIDKKEKIENYIDNVIAKVDFEEELKQDIFGISGLSILEEYLLGKRQKKYKKILQVLVEQNKVDLLIERTPFRTMDMKYSLNQANIKDNLPSYDSIFNKTILGKNLPLFYYSTTSAYSVTHTVFYITSMGKHCRINQEIKNKIFLFRTLIGIHINKKDLDVLSEILLCVLFLDIYDPVNSQGIFDFAIKFILENQNKNGSFPAPKSSNSRKKKKRFNEDYHTTLVCIGALECFKNKNTNT
ncbi:hypothetical protein EQ811_11750 [Staphylococcus capitis]|uniref:DUF6895 domain-containing protein n=1 Tax=Staphylococcus capitis TaxID=29388 RepID=A0A7Z8E247_STACP|nr:hypothetical protein [Staphylococcus capitis]MDS4004863.1 hypothetical protein [Staphylococcus capitis]TBW75378.1 hypothetical protein EQ811_11750 [Staphylococcus capitis]